MMVNLASVDEELIDDETPVEISAKQDPFHDNGEQEDKVRVDRRKLEQMLQVNGVGEGPSAEQFFTKVMSETETRISWPSKLKIGAKSKKDPHIKIAGLPENINRAKEMVVAVLESKANRVTLKMDVSHTDHSHIIGRRGQCIKKVMEETGCHIHFPDSNRGSATTEKSNQVSIAGQPEGVEKARTRIREHLPLVLLFEIPFNNTYLPFDPSAPSIQAIAQRYDVTFTPKGQSQIGSLIVVVRGSQTNLSNMQQAMGNLYKHLTGHFQIPNFVSLHFDIAPQHHVFVLGRAACNIKHIVDTTSAKIDFPDPSSMSRKGTVIISGSVSAVVQARALLVQSLPMLLMFDLKEKDANVLEEKPDKLKLLMEKFAVTITVKPKPKQTSKSVIIKSMENNSQNMYLTRLEILGSPMNPLTTRHPPLVARPETPEQIAFFPPGGMPWFPPPNRDRFPRHSPTAPPAIRTPSPPRLPPPGFEHKKSGSFNNGDYSSFVARSQGASSEGDSPKQSIDYKYLRRNSEPTPVGDVWPDRAGQNILNLSAGSSGMKQSFSFVEPTNNTLPGSRLAESHGSDAASSMDSSALSYNFDRFLNVTPQTKFIDYEQQTGKANELLMNDKVVRRQIRTPNDQFSGYLLSKSSPESALRKMAGKTTPESPLALPTTTEVPESPDERSQTNHALNTSVKIPLYSRPPPCSSSLYSKNETLLNKFSPKDTTLYDILKLYGVESFAKHLEDLEIDFATFLTLTKDDLKEAGVAPLGIRKRMEHAIKDMRTLKDKTVENDIQQRALDFRVGNPLEFNSRSGRW